MTFAKVLFNLNLKFKRMNNNKRIIPYIRIWGHRNRVVGMYGSGT